MSRLPHARRAAAMRVAVALVIAVVVAGCGSTTPSPPASELPASASPASAAPSSSSAAPSVVPSASAQSPAEQAAIYRAIEPQVVAIRGLQPKADVVPKLLDGPALQALVQKLTAEKNPPDVVAADGQLLKALGLLPADASLGDLYVKMLGSAVIGLYNQDDKHLYVVSRSGQVGPGERVTFAHEYTHALQDQHFDLKSLDISQVDQGDRSMARLSLVEGDATLVMTLWLQQHLSVTEMGQVFQDSADPAQLALLASLPAILREDLNFPYTAGLQLVSRLQQAGGFAAVDAAFSKPPDSTEQVLHPDKASDPPVAVTLPAGLASRMGTGWKVAFTDTFGEFQIGVWLRDRGVAAQQAATAAAGWGGDRVQLVTGPDGRWAVAWKTTWDTAADAGEFATAATSAIDGLTGAHRVVQPSGRASEVDVILAGTPPDLCLATEIVAAVPSCPAA